MSNGNDVHRELSSQEKGLGNTIPILFATATCPNCRIACQSVDKAAFSYKKVLANEDPDIAKAYGIKQAPTLVLPDGTKLAGAGAIKTYLSQIGLT